MMTIAQLRDKLIPILKGRELYRPILMTNNVLDYEIERAIATINRCRKFTPSNTILYDEKYEYLIIPMCINSLAKMGAEGEKSHSENGVSRSYGSDDDYPENLMSQIIPLIK